MINADEYRAALAEIEELWKAPVGDLDARRLIDLGKMVAEYEALKGEQHDS